MIEVFKVGSIPLFDFLGIDRYEEDVSAEQSAKIEEAWLPGSHENKVRADHFEEEKGKRPQEVVSEWLSAVSHSRGKSG